MRVFIAVAFSKEIKEVLHQFSVEAESFCKKGNFTPLENYHLTLRFLGEVDRQDIQELSDVLYMAASRIESFSLTLEKPGFFRQGDRRTFIVSLSGKRELSVLYERLEKNLSKQGFAREKRGYTPHITIARQVELFCSEATLFSRVKLPKIEIPVEKITLFESRRAGTRLTYMPLLQAKLNDRKGK